MASPGTERRIDRGRAALAAGVIAAALVVVVGITVANRGRSPNGSAAAPITTSTAPEAFVLPALEGGGVVSLARYRGTPVVVNLFASWCTACRGELPGLARVSARLAGRVVFIGVDSRENGDGLATASQYGITRWPLARDIDGVQDSGLHDALRADGMPATAFYSPSGRLLGVSYAALSEPALLDRLRQYYGIVG